MSYVYIESEHNALWTVGFYKPNGKWVAESDHNTEQAAAERVHYLNGGTLTEREKKATKGLIGESLIMASFLTSLRNEASHSRDFTVNINAVCESSALPTATPAPVPQKSPVGEGWGSL